MNDLPLSQTHRDIALYAPLGGEAGDSEPGGLSVLAWTVTATDDVFDDLVAFARLGDFGIVAQATYKGHARELGW